MSELTKPALDHSESLLRQAVKMGQLGHCLIDLANNQYESVSAEYAHLFGYTVEQFMLQFRALEGDMPLVYPDDRDIVAKAYGSGLNLDFEYRIVRSGGRVRTMRKISEVICDEADVPRWLLCTLQDITEHKHSNDVVPEREERANSDTSLQHSEKNYRELVENSEISMWNEDLSKVWQTLEQFRHAGVTDLRQYLNDNPQAVADLASQVKVNNVSRGTLKLFGTTSEKTFLDQIADSFGPGAVNVFVDGLCAIWDGKDAFRAEANYVAKDGREIKAIMSFHIPSTPEGFKSIPVSIADITERKQLETELVERTSYLNAILDSSKKLAIAATDLDLRIVYYNPIAQEIFGLTAKEVIGKTVMEIHTKQAVSAERFDNAIDIVRKSGEYNYSREQKIEGEIRHINASVSGIYSPERKLIGFVQMAEDVSEYKQMENELLKTSKLESLGALAGGIAHNFNNILTGLFGHLEIAGFNLPPDHIAQTHIQTANGALKRASSLTSQILTFAMGGDPQLEVMDLAPIIQDSAALALRGSKVKIVSSLPDGLWQGKGDKEQLSQVFTNLILNADQAMPRGGTLTIEGENIEVVDDSFAPPLSGKHVKLNIRDEGTGISAEHIGRVFDPFFTTRHVGSGLGLATVHSIISKHEGQIHVESQPENGANFVIFLPAAIGSHEANKVASWVVNDEPEGVSGHILIMDDDEMICEMLTSMLESIGLSVDTAVDGEEAIKKYIAADKDGSPVDIVIMDLTIPGGMGGEEAIEKLLAIDPQANAIVSSGYSTDPVMAHYRDYGFKDRLAKPYQMADMNRKLLRLLDKG